MPGAKSEEASGRPGEPQTGDSDLPPFHDRRSGARGDPSDRRKSGVSPLIVADRLLSLAKEADEAGLQAQAKQMLAIAHEILGRSFEVRADDKRGGGSDAT